MYFWPLVTTLLSLGIALIVVDKLISAPRYKEGASDHFNGKKFVNPNTLDAHHYGDVLKWWFSGNDKGLWHKLTEEDLTAAPKPDPAVHRKELHVTFINHATFLLQFDGLNILTDPIWSHRASPYQWIGPRRMRPPGLKFDDLPSIDTVLISHNHYDHLDLQTVRDLHRVHNPTFVVPLGVEQFLHEHHIDNTVQLDWWHERRLHERLALTAVPARHFSGRGLFDRNKTLWCGYVLHTRLGNIYFAGDTGYGDFFREIGREYGPMHTSFIPIGAYKPRWFMESIHLSPEEAVVAHRDVQSEQSFAMHFGTFPMADDGMFEATRALKQELRGDPLLQQEFRIPIEGDRHIIPASKEANS
ncbi:L-ascorbate metabolism protein UlaG, beta-lactamase superfamily [Fodinibius roseus]|uniref:L-ascorbate metabolism protein UlaG, beta-lactamase superfamily n=1 Tax=Fodinibius roseus TaxID=1194090 RepID=A0A1M4ZGH9_9BACT|nr:MBL fold metallo-hydrolase [Fodinibius roseus]SHF17154.1 L-ascorbate metabolism protein UlaG, beta-lactamase superfamily [Fodinibius roseus]